MKILALVAAAGLALAAAAPAAAADISGAGATFPFPLYAKWADEYKKQFGVGMNYQSIGSGGGIKQIQAKTVTFGASDLPLKADELEKSGLIQFPTVIGGVVPVMNLDGIKPGDVKLDGPTLAKIYMGEVKKWDDAAIKSLNAGIALPSTDIVVVRRSDGSGTTAIFTDYLSQVSPDWKSKIGSATSVQWPTGLGAKGNEGVAANVQQTKGSIGYVEYAYAKQNNMPYASMKNRDGQFVAPTAAAFQAAAADAPWSTTPGFALMLTNQAGAAAWPISGATFILMQKQPVNAEDSKAALKFFEWAYSDAGDKLAVDLDYVPLPNALTDQIKKVWAGDVKDASGKPVF